MPEKAAFFHFYSAFCFIPREISGLGERCASALFMASHCAVPLIGARFLSQIDTTQQAAFLVEGFDRCQEALQAFEVFLAFDCGERLRSLGSGFAPATSDALSIRGCVEHIQQTKARGVEQAFIFAWRTEKVIADGAASRNFLMRDDAANEESVAEKNAGIRLEHAKELLE